MILESYAMTQGIGLNISNLYSPCWGSHGYQGPYVADTSNLFRRYQFKVATPVTGEVGSQYQTQYMDMAPFHWKLLQNDICALVSSTSGTLTWLGTSVGGRGF
ncbi:hypothetical protein CB1_001938005 [Camelus ferus]|nr:hypothetical protein CB1_001938005 [Camelus ferus]